MTASHRGHLARAFGLSATVYLALAVLRAALRLAAVPRPPAAAALVLAQSLTLAVPWILLTPPLLWLLGRLRRHPGVMGAFVTAAIHLGLAVAVSLVDGLWGWSASGWLGLPRAVSPVLWYLGRLDQCLLLYLFLAGAAVVRRRRHDIETLELRAARLETRLLGARLHVLSLQLHPHFLFNTLHVVSELVHREPAAAAGLVRRLRTLLDRSFAEETAQEIPLREEVALLEAYAEIQRVRFAGALTVEITVDGALPETVVPRLLLQPLVENAIRHGTSCRASAGHIEVRCRREGDRLVLEVEDDGRGLAGGAVREGLGLGNTRSRLYELYGPDARLDLSSTAADGTLSRIELPLRPQAQSRPDDGEPAGPGMRDDIVPPQPVRWLRIVTAIAVAWIGAALVGTHEDVVAGWLTQEPEPFLALFRPRLGEALLWIPLTAGVLAYASRLARAGAAGPRLAGAHLAGGLAVLGVHLLAVREWVTPDMDGAYAAGSLLYDLCAYVALASGAHAWTLGRMVAERAIEAARLERDLAAARLASLRWRLNPAFLGATLDAVGSLAGSDPERADELTGRLGELLRLLLAGAGHDENALAEEAEFLGRQLAVLRLARGWAPALELDLGTECAAAAVPTMLLQPLAEMTGAPRIELIARRSGVWLVLTLRLPGATAPGLTDVLSAQLATRLNREPGPAAATMRPGDEPTIELRLRWRRVATETEAEPALAGLA
jgi:two-component system LytT family sensor kinase